MDDGPQNGMIQLEGENHRKRSTESDTSGGGVTLIAHYGSKRSTRVGCPPFAGFRNL
jgi:hypothetical protein